MDIAFQRFGNGRTLPFSNLFPLSCYHPDNLGFGNKLPFDGKSIRQEKERGKGKSRVKIKETNGVFFSIQTEIERPSFGRWLLRISDYVPGIPLRVKSRLESNF